MIKIGVLGYSGRMGCLIAEEIAASTACKLAGGVVREMKPEYKKAEGILITPHADEVVAISDVVIDFSTAAVTPGYARLAATHNKPFVSGTTGLDAKGIEALKEAAKKIPVFYAANTSLSLAAMKHITTLASKLLGSRDYDIAIIDEHHNQKKDAPSGTAKALGEAVIAGSGGKKTPAHSSIRAGNIVGEHEVVFAGSGEIIRLHHSVTDRRIFAKGALEAALWLSGKPAGFYGMDDVLGLKA
jgi:4-hydroxy-tetrahydrodipicolinate reductase